LAGILGTQSYLGADLNLIFQLATFTLVIISVAFKRKKKFKKHGQLMGIAIVMHIISFIAIMGPVFFADFEGFVSFISNLEVKTMWIHVIPGLISMMLGTSIVVLWALNPNNLAKCRKRKRIMDITVILWLISLIFGITTYTLFYM
jgi:uncharacterized membrane protein YozB (DUF420 family)